MVEICQSVTFSSRLTLILKKLEYYIQSSHFQSVRPLVDITRQLYVTSGR